MNNKDTYLIPANTKRGNLIFNIFTKLDLIIFSIGVSISLLLMLIIKAENLMMTMIILGPGLLVGFLVLPVPNYHNVLTVLVSSVMFITERRNFIWKGWCFYGDDKKKG